MLIPLVRDEELAARCGRLLCMGAGRVAALVC